MSCLEPTQALRARYHLAAQRFEARLSLTHRLFTKYAEDQPRVPAGSPNGGQWASEDGLVAPVVDAIGNFISHLPSLLLAGGFEPEDMGKTVQEFVSEKMQRRYLQRLAGTIFRIQPCGSRKSQQGS